MDRFLQTKTNYLALRELLLRLDRDHRECRLHRSSDAEKERLPGGSNRPVRLTRASLRSSNLNLNLRYGCLRSHQGLRSSISRSRVIRYPQAIVMGNTPGTSDFLETATRGRRERRKQGLARVIR